MKAISTEIRKVRNNSGEITFTFERKNIKNINGKIKSLLLKKTSISMNVT
mgnify:CR=1 FL=1